MRSHRNFLFNAISVFRMPLAFSANTVSAVFFSVVVSSKKAEKKKKNAHTEFPDVSDCYSSGLGLLVPIEQLYSSLFTLSRARQFL